MKHKHMICKVHPDSIAEELGIEPGDVLLSINENEIVDVFDYHFLVDNEYIELLIEKPNGEQWELEIEKDEEEELGLEFDQSLMDEYRSCRNHCIFCFIDQMPKGMRKTLYFKDDDSRLSFLQGNYITLTNMSDHDIERIIQYRLEPINISFHTTNPDLRCRMLNNRFAGEALKKVDLLYRGQIEMNGQIVLCKGVNDKAELERSIRDLTRYLPYLRSISVVPVGLTRYRESLCPLEPFTKEDARDVIAMIRNWQDKIYAEHQTHFIHAGDEWYILAGTEMPGEDRYDDYLQLENGVGMIRLLIDETTAELKRLEGLEAADVRQRKARKIALVTGELAAPYINGLIQDIQKLYPQIHVDVYPVHNDFFGEHITVSGLVTGQDIMKQLTGKDLGEVLLIPENMLRDGEEVFLDDFTISDLEKSLQVKIDIVKSSGQDFITAVIGANKL